MTKYEFLGDLSRLLAKLPEEERRQALHYYEDYFADAGEAMEQNVLQDLGSPEDIARRILSDFQEEAHCTESRALPDNSSPQQNFTHTAADNATQGHSSQQQDFSNTAQGHSSQQQDFSNTAQGHSFQQQDFSKTAQDTSSQQQGNPTGSSSRTQQNRNNTVILAIVLILTLPTWGSLLLGAIAAAIGILAAMILGGGGSAIGGVCAILGGIIECITGNTATGLMTTGVGCLLLSIGAAFCYLGIYLCIRFFPFLWKKFLKFIEWCRNKFFNRKEQS